MWMFEKVVGRGQRVLMFNWSTIRISRGGLDPNIEQKQAWEIRIIHRNITTSILPSTMCNFILYPPLWCHNGILYLTGYWQQLGTWLNSFFPDLFKTSRRSNKASFKTNESVNKRVCMLGWEVSWAANKVVKTQTLGSLVCIEVAT